MLSPAVIVGLIIVLIFLVSVSVGVGIYIFFFLEVLAVGEMHMLFEPVALTVIKDDKSEEKDVKNIEKPGPVFFSRPKENILTVASDKAQTQNVTEYVLDEKDDLFKSDGDKFSFKIGPFAITRISKKEDGTYHEVEYKKKDVEKTDEKKTDKTAAERYYSRY